MESRFGQDFSQVQVHTDPKAAESAQAINALAYTVGSKIAFEEHRAMALNVQIAGILRLTPSTHLMPEIRAIAYLKDVATREGRFCKVDAMRSG